MCFPTLAKTMLVSDPAGHRHDCLLSRACLPAAPAATSSSPLAELVQLPAPRSLVPIRLTMSLGCMR